MDLLNVTIGNWKPGIGDASFMGWLTVFSYYAVALICFLRVIWEKISGRQNDLSVYGFFGLMMILLGLQKQFNLLGALTEMGRMLAWQGGWMAHHRTVQAWAMFAVAVFGLILTGMLYRRFAQALSGPHKMAAAGLVYLLLFVILRGISLHQFGVILRYEIFGARLNWVLELTGICWIALAVLWPSGLAPGAARQK